MLQTQTSTIWSWNYYKTFKCYLFLEHLKIKQFIVFQAIYPGNILKFSSIFNGFSFFVLISHTLQLCLNFKYFSNHIFINKHPSVDNFPFSKIQ